MLYYTAAKACLLYVSMQVPPGLLPLTVRKDPRKLDAYFTLRRMASQQHMWFRLLGVAGAAVAVADNAEQASTAAAARAAGAARLARRYVRNRLQRQQDVHDAELQELQQQAQQETQQLLQEQAQQHADQQAVLQQQLDAAQKLHEEQQGQIRDLLAREKELVIDARAKADVLAEQRANVNSLEKQLVEVKSEKASLSHELREAREQLAKERGRVEVMMHEEKEVGASSYAAACALLLLAMLCDLLLWQFVVGPVVIAGLHWLCSHCSIFVPASSMTSAHQPRY
jgi:hypothetical protein